MIAGLLAGAGQIGLNLGSAFLNHAFNKEMQEDAQRHQIKMMSNAHQWEVADLRKAGLNPILSAGGSPGSYGSSAISSGGSDLGKGLSDTMKEAEKFANDYEKKQVDLLDSEISTNKSQEDLNSALADKARVEADAKSFEAAISKQGKSFLEGIGDISSAIGKNIGDKFFNNKRRLDNDSVITAYDRNKLNARLDELIEEDKKINPHLYEKNSGVYLKNGNSWTGSYVDKNGDVIRSFKTKRP